MRRSLALCALAALAAALPTPAALAQRDETAREPPPLSAYALRPEEAQPFDPGNLPSSHRVGENETLYDIATLYQTPVLALIEQNGLEPPYALAPGRVLLLPPARFHIVAPGESFEGVAARYSVDTRSLALLNRMRAPYAVRVGDRIVLPALAQAAPQVAPVSPPPPAPAAPAASGGTRFSKPLSGRILARFGPQPGGGRLDGVEIAGREGERVLAAADGDVVYAGADIPAYGALVLIRHADNYVTAYAFNRRALVHEGDRVSAGAAIAELGPRPDGRARLLFQVRRGSAAVDPEPLLRR